MNGATTLHQSRLVILLKQEHNYVILPAWGWILAAASCAWGLSTANPFLTPFAIAILIVCVQLLWRRGEPPVLVFACCMQWLQAAGAIFYANSYGLTLEQAAGGSWEYPFATALSLWAVLALAVGMRLALVHTKKSQTERLAIEGSSIGVGRAFIAYLLSFVVGSAAYVAAWLLPSITQLIISLVTLKWVAVFILAYAVIEQRRGYPYLVCCILIEVSYGLLSFFAGFKNVFFIVLVVVLTSPLALKGKRLAMTFVVAAAIFSGGIVWTAIKQDYREFLNAGSNEQVVTVSAGQSVERLVDLVAKLNWQDISEGLDAMILRVSYTQYFAYAMRNVPDSLPYEKGKLWLEAIEHVFTPRLFFPNKPVLDDSERTRLYTGIDVAGLEKGTSIGIGYVAESYIDFGPILMFVPIFLLGGLFGLIYRLFIIRAKQKLLGTALAVSILVFQAYTIETSNIKTLGGTITSLLVLTPLYFAFGRQFLRSLRS